MGRAYASGPDINAMERFDVAKDSARHIDGGREAGKDRRSHIASSEREILDTHTRGHGRASAER